MAKTPWLTLALWQSSMFFPLPAQGPTQSQTISVNVLMAKEFPVTSEAVNAVVRIRNVSQHVVVETGDTRDFNLHVLGPKGEPPKTSWYQHMIDEGFPVTLSAVPRDIQPGKSVDRTFRLSAFYDLSTPGKYTVYLEVHDASENWIETNRANFNMISR